MKKIKSLSKNIRVTSKVVNELSGYSYQIGSVEFRWLGFWWVKVRREFSAHPAVIVLSTMERVANQRGWTKENP